MVCFFFSLGVGTGGIFSIWVTNSDGGGIYCFNLLLQLHLLDFMSIALIRCTYLLRAL